MKLAATAPEGLMASTNQTVEAFYFPSPMQTLPIFLVIGVMFGSLGAAVAYLITYKEWEHHYPSPKEPRKMAMETALFTFTFFMGVMLLLWLVMK